MLIEDKEAIKEIMINYSAKEFFKVLSELALEVAGELSDNDFNERAKEYTKFSVALEEISLGKPYLIK